ncbi:hypothetical protein D3C76_1520250 [compost metagenome]
MTGQAGGEGAEAIVEHQHPLVGAQAILGGLFQEVLVGRVEGLQRVVALVGLADQVELGEGAGQNRHRNWRCLPASR